MGQLLDLNHASTLKSAATCWLQWIKPRWQQFDFERMASHRNSRRRAILLGVGALALSSCPASLLFAESFVGELHPDKNNDNKKHVLYTHKNIIVKYKDQVLCL
ncbi:Transmembrane 9 superfamily member 1 [Camellia lanceoleosa]|uniref:Transmembrane 9 superfamily member 1 n=1 Tax=Camellia lanceoleosa TaxID=1840588 RepID=A0ACC0HSX5_9ERIC|nr:Transmembrane 9 superfamily member 1 [Camellia lanceoleosa]